MSQDDVEKMLGRMLTDRDFFAACCNSLEKACSNHGFLLSNLEYSAIRKTDMEQLSSLSHVLDERIKRA